MPLFNNVDPRFMTHDRPQRRIVHLIFSRRIAGSERYCIDLANRQAGDGQEVHVIGAKNSAIANALVPAVRFHAVGRLFRGFVVRRIFSRLRPEIGHAHLSAACKILGGLVTNAARIGTLHVGYKAHQHARLDALICVNRTQRTRIENFGGLIRVIPNWAPATPTLRPAGIRTELGIAPDAFLVGSVGRLHPSKGPDLLIRAFRAAAPASAHLVIVGEGPQRCDLERLRGGDSRIHLIGYRPVVHGCLQDLDLFVSPSREESFGLAILEAMQARLPIIATAAEGPSEFLLDQPATLVPLDSADALADELRAAHRRFAAGRLGRIDYDLAPFSPQRRVSEIMDFYEDTLAAKAAGRAPAHARRVAIPA